MDTVKRNIKFCYYMVVNVDSKGKFIERFNLAKWFSRIKKEGNLQKNIQLSDCKVHMDKVELVDDKVYYVQVFKLREVNIPSKIKDGETSEPLELESDEYIGEDINFLYDRNNSVCMLQQNRNSIGVKRLVEWINMDFIQDNYNVSFVPISSKFKPNRIGNKKIRKLEFSLANLEPDCSGGTLSSIIKSIDNYKGINARIVISCGRKKDNELDRANVVDLVEELQANPGIVRDGKVSLKREPIYDDDKAHIEVVDIFEDSLNNIITFDVEKRKSLDYKQAKAKMLNEYSNNILKINDMCGW